MRDFDDPPEDLTAWMRAGMRRVEALEWRRWRFTLDEAQAWRRASVTVALTAAQWRTAAVGPEAVDQWRDAGIGPGEAVQWHEFAVDLERAKEFRARGRKPADALRSAAASPYQASPRSPEDEQRHQALQRMQEAGVPGQILHGYLTAPWFDDDAVAWAVARVPAPDAKLWAALGLRPGEAFDLVAAERTPSDVMAEWWRAGVPLDEVGDWLGAGLSAAEAVAQRAAGVTVEQAAALRALRDVGRS